MERKGIFNEICCWEKVDQTKSSKNLILTIFLQGFLIAYL